MRERPANTLKMLDMVTKRRKIEIQEEAVCIGVLRPCYSLLWHGTRLV